MGNCPEAELEGLCSPLGMDASFRMVEGADHFFGYEDEVTTAQSGMLAASGA